MHQYLFCFDLLTSGDGGATWTALAAGHVHVDHHALYLNPADPHHIISGNDGGINISWDRGEHWIKCNSPAVGQCYAIETDQRSPFHIYAGFQDNGTWVGPSDHAPDPEWVATGRYGWEELGGGDGMQVEVDPRNPDVVITGYQFGNYQVQDLASGEALSLRPMHALGEPPLRWNWQTPVALSPHQPDILYLCSNKVHRSLDQGQTWETISPDLTRGGRAGNVPFGTISTFHESPLRFGQCAVGTDDGRIHVSRDGGYTWVECASPLPQAPPDRTLWVTEVLWSAHHRNRLYVAMNGYRLDHFEAYVFQTDDDGRSWERLFGELPPEPVNALAQPKTEGAEGWLFVGTDHGLYGSVDGGRTAFVASRSLPRVAVHDLAFQNDAKALVIGTHGRSVYVLDARPAFASAERLTMHRTATTTSTTTTTATTTAAAPAPDLASLLTGRVELRVELGAAPEVTYDPEAGERRWDGTFPDLPAFEWDVFSDRMAFLNWEVLGPDSQVVVAFSGTLSRGWQVLEVPLSVWEPVVGDAAVGGAAGAAAVAGGALDAVVRSEDLGPEGSRNGVRRYLTPGTYRLRGYYRDWVWSVNSPRIDVVEATFTLSE